jgi:hypothetical protein
MLGQSCTPGWGERERGAFLVETDAAVSQPSARDKLDRR